MADLPNVPKDYLEFLETHDGSQPYEYDNVGWWVATREELLSNINIDGEEYPYIHQLQGFTKTIAQFFGGKATFDADGSDFAFARLAEGLAFATGNGDVLFFDPSDNFSVWLFHHDGGDVERLKGNFTSWFATAELDADY